MASIPLYNIVQFLSLPGGYASLYSIWLERLGNGSHSGNPDSDEAAAKELWTTFVRTLSARDQHELNWIEKWTFKALIYGVQDRDHDHTTTLIPFTLAKAESLALFTDFSWYLLSDDESKAIKMLNVCRSNFQLAVLPSGFKVTDVVVEFHRTPADNSTLLDRNIRLVDGLVMRKKSRRRPLGHLSSSPHTVDSVGYREAKPQDHPGRAKLSPQHLYPTAEDSDIDGELPSITVTKEPSHQFELVKGPALEYTAEQSQSQSSEVSYSTAIDNQVDLQGPYIDDTITPRIKNRSSTSKGSSRGESRREGNCLSKKRKFCKFTDYSLDTDMHVQSDASSGNLPLPKRKITCSADSETEPPRKRRGLVSDRLDTTFGCEPSTMQLSRGFTASASESNDINTSADGSPIITTSNANVPQSPADANAQEHESPPQHAWDGKKAFLKMSNSLCVVQHLLIPLAQRRESRGAAAKAQGMIHAQYAQHPVLDINDAASSAHNVKRKKTKKELRGQTRTRAVADTRKVTQEKNHQEHAVDLDTFTSTARMKMSKKSHVQAEEHIPVDSACSGESSSFTVEREEPRPECADTDKNMNAKPKKRGRPLGSKNKDVGNKSKGNGERKGKGKGKGKKKHKEIEMPTTVGTTGSSHSIVNESNSPTCTSSLTAVVSSSSGTAFSSPLTQGDSSTEVSPSAERSLGSGFTRNENDDHDRLEKKSQTNLSELNSRLPLSLDNVDGFRRLIPSSQGEHSGGGDSQGQDSMDDSQSNHVIPQSDDETLHDCSYKEISSYYGSRTGTQSSQASRTPWSVSHDETNYSNNSRPPGINDTHFWSTSQIPKVNFPPLHGDSLCSDTRLYKPPLPNPPPVWAQSRQELCESLSYFRAYQGGVYTHKQRAEGYLLDGYPARYDIWHSDGRYIISHGGGHSALDRLTGRVSLVEDQVADSGSCAALISSWKAAHAIALIAGNGYRLFPYSLDNMNYIVLGYYHIVHAWEEPEPSPVNSRGYCVRWKFLFRWIEAQGSPWWLKENDNKFTSMDMPMPTLASVCQVCGKHSFSIFGYGWVCTQSGCRAFFQLLDKANVVTEGYNPAFLAPREDPPPVRNLKLEIRPKPPVQPVIHSNTEQAQIATSRHFWKGFWCEKCGKLSCREFWSYWKCGNCNHTFAIKAVIQTPPKINNVKSERFVSQEAGITETTSRLGNGLDPYECYTFTLPFNRGKIHLIKASGQSLQVADRIFRQYQLDASNDESFFRRYSMKNHKLKGRMLSHYFSQNSGEPYEYIGGTNNTVELDKYKSVTKALEYIRSRATLALKYNPDFNEVLSAGYMAEQKMEFHSDGEKDLGPIVASLSLGSPAIMKFRPVPSKWMSDDGQLKEGRKTPPVVIELTLRHGDALVMEGAEIQEYYQHAVHPCGFRIAATARRVDIT